MKALCVKQPFASMIASGKKSIEIRTWKTKYRGKLLIVATKSPKIQRLPSGQAICIVTLRHCRKMRKSDIELSYCEYSEEYYSWIFEKVRELENLIEIKGRLGIIDISNL